MWPFEVDQIDDLDLAHMVPKFLGGKAVTLACHLCNNWIGAHIEGQDAKRLADRRRLAGRKGVGKPVRVRVGDGEDRQFFTAFMRVSSDASEPAITLELITDHANPALIDDALKVIERAHEDRTTFQTAILERPAFDVRIANLTYFAVAHLTLFHFLGYEWACTPLAH